MHDRKTIEWFHRRGQTPPAHHAHGTESEIRENLRRLKPNSWRLEGNKLIGDTEVGELVQFIPTDYICHGSDEEGLPILKKVVVQ